MRTRSLVILLAVPFLAFAQSPWVKLNRPTTKNLSRVCFIDSVQGWVAGDSGGVFRTTNGGQSWKAQDTKITNSIFDLFMLDRRYGWAVALRYQQDTSWYGTVLLRTTNGGDTWAQKNLPGEYFYTVAFFDSVNGWMAGHQGKLRRTTDAGTTWTAAVVDSSSVSSFPIIHLDFYSRNYGFALGGFIDAAGIMWRTTNGGERWAATNPGGDGEPLHGLHYIDSLNLIAVGGDFDLGSGMVRSEDGGQTWQYTYLGIWGEARAIAFRTPGEGFVPLGFPGTYMVTTDTGRTWHDFPTPDTGAVFDVKFPDSLHGYMVGAHGTILKYNPGITSVRPVTPDRPEAASLYQNYPNPFNPGTTISFILPHSSFATVRVFDVLGRKVATLLSGNEAAGVHEVEFNGDGYPSGVYYYELTTTSARDRMTQVRKMLLVK